MENFIAQIVDVTEQIADRRESERARRLQAEADLRYRRLMENSAIGISLVRPDGTFELTNRALCDFFGYDAETLSSKTWRELIPDDDLAADLENIRDMLAGRIENYRLTKRYIHADGHTMWGPLGELHPRCRGAASNGSSRRSSTSQPRWKPVGRSRSRTRRTVDSRENCGPRPTG